MTLINLFINLNFKPMEKITKLLTLTLLLVFASGLKAQDEFAPVGAEWHYEREIYNYDEWKYDKVAYDRFRSVDTVTINGFLCKEIELFQSIDCNGEVNPYYETRYINQDGDKIYEMVDGERYLLYDFSKQIGEYWTITHYNEFGDTTYVHVQDITEITLEDGTTRRVFITSATGWDDSPVYCTNIIEGIGLDKSLFPFYELVGPPPCRNTGIRCYSDENLNVKFTDKDCDYVSQDLNVLENNENDIRIYPNPTNGNITIELAEENNTIDIYDNIGKRINSFQTDNKLMSIDISEYPAGLYLVVIKNNNKTIFKKIIKK